jgi:serine/threonine protein kinase
VKLADFGISTAIHHRFDSGSREWPSFCQVGHDGSGSTPYMAPEMFQHRGSGLTDNEHSTKCDVWSAGVLLYVMLSGYYPYGDDYSTPARICSGELVEFSEDRWQHVSEDAKDLIRSLMQHDVEKRPAAHQALEHQWFHSPESTSDYPGFDATFFVEHSPNELAHILLQKLRKWRKMPQLRRWAIAAMARNLTGDYEAKHLANVAYQTFSDSSDTLKCKRLEEVLAEVQAENEDEDSPSRCLRSESWISAQSWRTIFSDKDARKNMIRSKIRDASSFVTGITVRKVSKKWTPFKGMHDDQLSDSSSHPSAHTVCEDIADLVRSLDGTKSGTVDYTLLLAAMLPEDVYGNDEHIAQVFQIFDVRGRGQIRPQDGERVGSSGNFEM